MHLLACLSLLLLVLCAAAYDDLVAGDRAVDDRVVAALQDKLSAGDKRYTTMATFFDLVIQRNLSTIVEAGTSRGGRGNCGGDGCFTYIAAHFSQLYPQANVYSVDISERNLHAALTAVLEYDRDGRVNFVHSDSVEFLELFEGPIDALYLDSYDYTANDVRGCQEHQLREIQAAAPKLHADSVVLMDDCALPGGGKCGLSAEFLENNGWVSLTGNSTYQRIYVRAAETGLGQGTQ